MESGADATVKNRKKQTPVSLAQNVIVQRWLEMAAGGLNLQPIRPKVRMTNDELIFQILFIAIRKNYKWLFCWCFITFNQVQITPIIFVI